MFSSYKPFLLCRRYDKDIWGYVVSKHKTVNLARTKVRPNVENVPHLAKKKWLLQDFSKKLSVTGFWVLNFSFEIIRWMKKRRPRKMKNWMWFFFLTKILRMFYGNLKKQTFKNFCNSCIAKKSNAIFLFLKIFEFWLPMFIYRIGFSPSLEAATRWVTSGLISVNGKVQTNSWKPVWLYDYVTFDTAIWSSVTSNLVKIFYYGSKAAKRWRCVSTRLWALEKTPRAHFISLPEYTYVDLRTFSFYWWKEAVPNLIWFYFSVNLSNILKYTTI